jgi:hypothetical protein
MKHILNNLNIDEKLRIKSQYKNSLQVKTSKFRNLIESKLGNVSTIIEQQNPQQQTLVNKVATEGLKNVTPEMIQSPPFKGNYSGYVFGGTFSNVNYSWDCDNVEGMSGVREMVDGKIISEKNSQLSSQTKQDITDADPNGVFIGFYSQNIKFVIYMTTSKKPKCVNF